MVIYERSLGADQGPHVSNCSITAYVGPHYQNIALLSSHATDLIRTIWLMCNDTNRITFAAPDLHVLSAV